MKFVLITLIASALLTFGTVDCRAVESAANSLIKNGNFAQKWIIGLFAANVANTGSEANAIMENGILRININKPGSATYAIQLIQAPIEIVTGLRYRVSFDAKASED